jgi:uncharacterized ParB-like nuclease family protein
VSKNKQEAVAVPCSCDIDLDESADGDVGPMLDISVEDDGKRFYTIDCCQCCEAASARTKSACIRKWNRIPRGKKARLS